MRHHSQVLLPATHAMVIAALPAIDALRSITAKFAMALFQVGRRATAGLAGLRCWGLLLRDQQELCQAVGQSEVPCCPTELAGCSNSSLPSADDVGQVEKPHNCSPHSFRYIWAASAAMQVPSPEPLKSATSPPADCTLPKSPLPPAGVWSRP